MEGSGSVLKTASRTRKPSDWKAFFLNEDRKVELSQLRQDINEIDNELMVLLAKRRRISHLVAEAKIAQNKPVRDIKREEEMLVSLIQGGQSLGLDAYYVKQIFQTIIEDSVLHQQALLQKHCNASSGQVPVNRVAYLGSQGSYSDLATQKYFSRHQSELKQLGCSSFEEIIEKVEHGHADHGILPIENTSSGSINEVYDLLQHTSLSIVVVACCVRLLDRPSRVQARRDVRVHADAACARRQRL